MKLKLILMFVTILITVKVHAIKSFAWNYVYEDAHICYQVTKKGNQYVNRRMYFTDDQGQKGVFYAKPAIDTKHYRRITGTQKYGQKKIHLLLPNSKNKNNKILNFLDKSKMVLLNGPHCKNADVFLVIENSAKSKSVLCLFDM